MKNLTVALLFFFYFFGWGYYCTAAEKASSVHITADALAIAINAFGNAGAETALVIAVSYIIQVQAAAWYVKFTYAVFGPVSTVPKTIHLTKEI